MKTVQELYNEVIKNDELKKSFVEALKADKLKDFLEEQGCDAAPEEIREFLTEKESEESSLELSLEKLKEVAGGTAPVSASCTCFDNSADCSNTCIKDCC